MNPAAESEYEERVVARILDFLHRSTPWPRRLWTVGSVVLLRELLEVSEAVRDGILSQEALRFLIDEARATVGRDPGIGATRAGSLNPCLASDLVYAGAEFRKLSQLVAQCDADYLGRWEAALRQPLDKRPKPERAARALAAHLLGLGFSGDYLHRWWTFRLRYRAEPMGLADIVAESVDALAGVKKRSYRVLMAFRSEPSRAPLGQGPWLTGAMVSDWLRREGHDPSGLRQHGGVLITVDALDPWAAVDAAADRIEAIVVRAALSAQGSRLRVDERAWVEGERKSFRARQRRRVEVAALHRERRSFDLDGELGLDDALHLLGPLDDGPAGSAVAGGWAAIEALLSMPGDKGGKVLAADRAADLAACSWPRAELTALAYRFGQENAGTATEAALAAASTNRDRAVLLALEVANGGVISYGDHSDRAAVERMRAVLASPARVLADVRAHMSRAMRRLYRQRNLVLHGGNVRSVALQPALRTAAPLVGAAFDRIAHAWLVEGVEPRDLVARALIGLDRCDGTDVHQVTDLLEAPSAPGATS